MPSIICLIRLPKQRIGQTYPKCMKSVHCQSINQCTSLQSRPQVNISYNEISFRIGYFQLIGMVSIDRTYTGLVKEVFLHSVPVPIPRIKVIEIDSRAIFYLFVNISKFCKDEHTYLILLHQISQLCNLDLTQLSCVC